MADQAQPLDRNGAENRGPIQVEKSRQVRRVPSVDFEQLNFEQRRMPYNSRHTGQGGNNPETNGANARGSNR